MIPNDNIPLKEPRTGRLTVVGSISHQIPGKQPTHTPIRYCATLNSNEQVFVRNSKTGDDWTQLETGWVERPSLLVLSNDEGVYVGKVPTEEERKDTESRVIQLGYMVYRGNNMETIVPIALIRPKRTLELEPYNSRNLYVRCIHGEARYTLTLIPE